MRIRHLIALTSLSMLVGCQDKPTVCEASGVRDKIVTSFTSDKASAAFALTKNLQMKEIKVIKTDESTGTTDCQARVVIPTEQGPLDGPITYRMGPVASTGKQVFMYAFLDKPMEDLWDLIEIAAKRQSAPAN